MLLNQILNHPTRAIHPLYTPITHVPAVYQQSTFCQHKAAVLILVIEDKNRPSSLLLTKRTMHVDTHKGQICFPGGHFEQQDTSLIDTATRECNEEVGISPDQIRLLGTLPLQQTRFDQDVLPVIAKTTGPHVLNVQANEVMLAF